MSEAIYERFLNDALCIIESIDLRDGDCCALVRTDVDSLPLAVFARDVLKELQHYHAQGWRVRLMRQTARVTETRYIAAVRALDPTRTAHPCLFCLEPCRPFRELTASGDTWIGVECPSCHRRFGYNAPPKVERDIRPTIAVAFCDHWNQIRFILDHESKTAFATEREPKGCSRGAACATMEPYQEMWLVKDLHGKRLKITSQPLRDQVYDISALPLLLLDGGRAGGTSQSRVGNSADGDSGTSADPIPDATGEP